MSSATCLSSGQSTLKKDASKAEQDKLTNNCVSSVLPKKVAMVQFIYD